MKHADDDNDDDEGRGAMNRIKVAEATFRDLGLGQSRNAPDALRVTLAHRLKDSFPKCRRLSDCHCQFDWRLLQFDSAAQSMKLGQDHPARTLLLCTSSAKTSQSTKSAKFPSSLCVFAHVWHFCG